MSADRANYTLWKALYDYNTDRSVPTDLCFQTGDIIQAAPNANDPGWLYGFVADDPAQQEGEVPANFVEAVEPRSPPPPYQKPTPAPAPAPSPAPMCVPLSSGHDDNSFGPFDSSAGGAAASADSTDGPANYDEQLPCPNSVDFATWRTYSIDQQHQVTLEINTAAFERQLQRERNRRSGGQKGKGNEPLFPDRPWERNRVEPASSDPLLTLAPSAVNASASASSSSSSRASTGSAGSSPNRPPSAEDEAALDLARRLQMEEIARASGSQVDNSRAMHMLADALENGGQTNSVPGPGAAPRVLVTQHTTTTTTTAHGHDTPTAPVVTRRLSAAEINSTPVAAYVGSGSGAAPPDVVLDDTIVVKYINRTKVEFKRSVLHHESKVRFAMRAPGAAHNAFSADLTSRGNFLIFDERGKVAGRLDCLPNKNTFVLREHATVEGDQFAPGLCGVKFKTLTSRGYKFRYGLFACAKNWRDPFVVPQSDWMKKFLEIESVNLDTQVSPASDILHGEEYNILVSSAKYHLTPNQGPHYREPPYIESVKQCIFVHPQSGSACVMGKIAEDQFDVLWNKQITPLFAFAMAISSIRARNT